MPRAAKVTERWDNFLDRVEALELGINGHLLYRELANSQHSSLVNYAMYLRSELEVFRQWVAIRNTRGEAAAVRRILQLSNPN
jgi:hypothetical protein